MEESLPDEFEALKDYTETLRARVHQGQTMSARDLIDIKGSIECCDKEAESIAEKFVVAEAFYFWTKCKESWLESRPNPSKVEKVGDIKLDEGKYSEVYYYNPQIKKQNKQIESKRYGVTRDDGRFLRALRISVQEEDKTYKESDKDSDTDR